ncbi:MAG: methyltransferase [Chloroflexi bacterium]|nr:methyltransferase [Chloroflexota bacterium]
MTGYYTLVWYLRAAAELRIADAFRGDETLTCEDIAARIGAHAPTLYRLLRALASYDVFTEVRSGVFALTPVAECLRSDSREFGSAGLLFVTSPHRVASYRALAATVRIGTAPERDYWAAVQDDPEYAAVFDAYQASVTLANVPAFLAAYDYSPFRSIVDVGGGDGTLLNALLEAVPNARGILFDQPPVVARAAGQAPESLLERLTFTGGDFFETVPAGADAYLLKYILHDWNDEACLRILRACRAAAPPGAKLLIFEVLLPSESGNERSGAKTGDLTMLLNNDGRERTLAEYRALLGVAGFELQRAVPTSGTFSILEAI